MAYYALRMIPNYRNITEIPDGHLPKDLDQYGYEANWSHAFVYCGRLEQLPDPFYNWNGVTNISSIFFDCSNLTGNIPNIPNSVTDMYYTFFSCQNLTGNIPNIPNSVTNMDGAFSHCRNLTSNIPNIPDSVTDMGYAFYNCKNLSASNVYIFSDDIIDCSSAFYGCTNRINIFVHPNTTTYNSFKQYFDENNYNESWNAYLYTFE